MNGLGQPTNLRLEQFDTEKGLSQNLVYAIVQDKQGFLWFGTDEGLNRFDGYEFKTFLHDPQDSTSLIDNSVHSLLLDRRGILWIGTSNGISKYNPVDESFENIKVEFDGLTEAHGTDVSVMKEDRHGNVWVGYLGSGIDIFRPNEKIIFHYTVHSGEATPQHLPDDYITALDFLENDIALVSTRSGLVFIAPEGTVLSDKEALTRFPWKKNIGHFVKSISISSNKKNLWMGTEAHGFYWIDLDARVARNYNTQNSSLLFNNNVPAVLEDSKGNVWIGGEAIYFFDRNTGRLSSYDEKGIIDATNKNPVLSIFEDQDHNVWFGTYRFGALKYNPKASQILLFQSGQGTNSLTNGQILSLMEDDRSAIWVGTDGGGLFKMQSDLNAFEPAPGGNNFSAQVIKSMTKDAQGNFWMGTWDGGMMKYNPLNSSVKIFNPEKKNFESRHVWDLQPDWNGNLWIATLRDGLCHFNTKTYEYKYFRNEPTDSASLANNDVTTVFLDSENILWVGTSDGLSVLYPDKKKFVNRQKKDSITNPLCFFEDAQKRIWIGTNGGGIILLDKKLRILKMLTEKDGLPSSTVCAMLPDDKNQLWISSYKGLFKINMDDFAIEEMPLAAGLQGREFIARSAFKTHDGRMLFGGVNGFNLFHPDSLHFSTPVSKIVFTSLKIQGREIKPGEIYNNRKIIDQSISLLDEIHLTYKDNSITLTFSPLVYNWQTDLQFSYKLEDFDLDWQYVNTKDHLLHYTSLDPGEYILKIRAAMDGRNWKELKQFKITVAPPWWKTIYFRAAALLLMVAFLYSAYVTRVKLLKRQRDKLNMLVRERTKRLKQSNDEIQGLLQELADQKNMIEEQNHELVQTNNEIVSQRDALEIKSHELEKVQSNLRDTNLSLETLVGKRTQKLSSTLRELETFLYRASHDLRGPISSMLGLLNVASIEKDPRQLKQIEGFFRKSVMQLDQVLQRLLLKHTLERRKMVYENFEYVDLTQFVEEVANEIPHFRRSDFALAVSEKINFATDRLVLKTIIVSLLENAFFFSTRSDNKRVSMAFQQMTDWCLVEVKDFGVGIKPEQNDKIFQMFYRGNEVSTGNGLGLYLLKSALDKINASIEFESEEGRFTIFRIRIPFVNK